MKRSHPVRLLLLLLLPAALLPLPAVAAKWPAMPQPLSALYPPLATAIASAQATKVMAVIDHPAPPRTAGQLAEQAAAAAAYYARANPALSNAALIAAILVCHNRTYEPEATACKSVVMLAASAIADLAQTDPRLAQQGPILLDMTDALGGADIVTAGVTASMTLAQRAAPDTALAIASAAMKTMTHHAFIQGGLANRTCAQASAIMAHPVHSRQAIMAVGESMIQLVKLVIQPATFASDPDAAVDTINRMWSLSYRNLTYSAEVDSLVRSEVARQSYAMYPRAAARLRTSPEEMLR